MRYSHSREGDIESMVENTTDALSVAELGKMDAYWRAANYLSVGQIYLMDNPLLRKPLLLEHVKPRLLGHWGTTPGLRTRHPPGDPEPSTAVSL
jgi:phosphoketolase